MLRDTFDFVRRLREWSASRTLLDSQRLVSFDIDSMYTATPVGACLEVIRERVQAQAARIEDEYRMNADTVVELVSLCTTVLFVSPDGWVYQQLDGFPMGGPVSGPACQLYAEMIEQKALRPRINVGELQPPPHGHSDPTSDAPMPNIPVDTTVALQAVHPSPPTTPVIWLRYVDDSFCIIDNDFIMTFRDTLNAADPTGQVRWTFEVESCNQLPFLDCLVSRRDNALHFDHYRKPSANSRFIPFDSAHELRHRLSVVSAFLLRFEKICDPDCISMRRNWLLEVAKLNGIPEKMFAEQVRRFDVDMQTVRGAKAEKTRIVIPYYPGIAEHLRRLLSTVLDVATRPHTLADILLPKAKFQAEPHLLQAPVYVAFCATCEKRYYGESAASVATRFNTGHWTAIRSGRSAASALATHEATFPEHRINPQIVVLFREPMLQRRLLLEAMAGRAEAPERSINFEWEESLEEPDEPHISLRRQGRLAPIPQQWITLLRNVSFPKLIAEKMPEKPGAEALERRCDVFRTENETTEENKRVIIDALCMCRDVAHVERKSKGMFERHRVKVEMFGQCPHRRCRFCCGILCFNTNTTCSAHRCSRDVMRAYSETLRLLSDTNNVCVRCSLLIRRVTPVVCNGGCSRAWHPGCIPPRERANVAWKCRDCLMSPSFGLTQADATSNHACSPSPRPAPELLSPPSPPPSLPPPV